MRKRSNTTLTQVFSELSLGVRGKKLNDTKYSGRADDEFNKPESS